MKNPMKKLAVLFSLVFTLVLTGAVTTVCDTAEDAGDGTSIHSDFFAPIGIGN